MIVLVVKQRVEDGARIGLSTSRSSRVNNRVARSKVVVGAARHAEIHCSRPARLCTGTRIPRSRRSAPRQRRQAWRQIEQGAGRHLQAAIAGQLGIQLFDGADLLMLALRRKLHQPGNAGRIAARADVTGRGVCCKALGARLAETRRSAPVRAKQRPPLQPEPARFPGQGQQAPVGSTACGSVAGTKRSAHGAVPDERQPIQGQDDAIPGGGTNDPSAAAPAIGQAVRHQAGQPMQIRRKIP